MINLTKPLVLLLFFASRPLLAQNRLSGTVTGADGKPQPDVIIQLLKASDSSLVKSEFSALDGSYLFAGVPEGGYLLQLSNAGSTPQLSGPLEVRGDVTHHVALRSPGASLQEVQVTTRKPYIERSKGKVLLNVENSINADGSSAYEILEKAPGVRIDNNDNISLSGKPGTVIYIDGKPSPMTGADLANYLRGINSSSIEKIELISNPSSKFDASGSSVINIRLKKDRKVGTNGSANVFYGQGVYPKAGGSVSLNHRDKKVNVFGSYNYSNRRAFSRLQLERRFSLADSFTGAYVQDNMLKFDFNTHVARAGVDFYANRKNTFGVLASGVDTRFNPNGENISEVYDHNNTMSSLFGTSNRSRDHWHNFALNFNYNHVFDSLGSELSTDLDYAKYGNETEQNFTTRYYDLKRVEYARPYLLYGDLGGSLDIYSIKNDLTKVFAGGLRIEGGHKSSYVVADNQLSFFDRSYGTDIFDSTKSNHFIYHENINAAYVNLSKDIRKWSVQAGLRVEHTAVTGEQLVYSQRFSRNYAQLFPSGVVTYKQNDNHSLELSFSRRIRRPSYEQLNPFKFYLDPTTYKEGNPYLRPEITESAELTHIWRQKISTALSYSRTHDNIIETIAPLQDNSRVTVQSNRNLAKVEVYSFNFSVPLEIRKWWYTSTSLNVYYALYSGNIANTPLVNRGNLVGVVNTSNTFNLNKKWSVEVSGNYNSREIYAYDVIRPRWFVNAGVQCRLWNNKGVLRLNVNDIFYTNRISARVQYTGYTEYFLVRRDTRVATVSFTWKFGKATVPAAKRRQGGAEDLKERAGKGNG
jgi:hypothetical protein